MSLDPGTRLGPYEIVAQLGAGGMGEVYRARDSRLGRDVAIKALPAGFAQDVERHVRGQRYDVVLGLGKTWTHDVVRCGGGCHQTYMDLADRFTRSGWERALGVGSVGNRVALALERRACAPGADAGAAAAEAGGAGAPGVLCSRAAPSTRGRGPPLRSPRRRPKGDPPARDRAWRLDGDRLRLLNRSVLAAQGDVVYAVVRIAGKQFLARPEARLRVPLLEAEVGSQVEFDQVLLVSREGALHRGTPVVAGARVTAEVVTRGRERKILVFHKKKRKDHRKKNGHRQPYSEVRIRDIQVP